MAAIRGIPPGREGEQTDESGEEGTDCKEEAVEMPVFVLEEEDREATEASPETPDLSTSYE